jgi:hypothetical protein
MACPFHKETGMEEGEQLVMVLIPAAVVAAMEQRIKFLERRLIGLAKEYTPVSPEAVSQSEEEAEALLGRFRLVRGEGFRIVGPLPPQST